jgi:phosphate butyryltransferase
MIKSLDQIVEELSGKDVKKVVSVANAADIDVLESLKMAKERNLISAVLVGDEKEINKIASEINLDISD